MANMLHKMTAKGAEAITAPGRHSDGGGLYLTISKTGARSWVFFYKRNGKQKEMGLGSARSGGVTLAQARDAAAEARRVLASGDDPLEARRAAQAAELAAEAAKLTFGEYAATYIALHEGEWRNDKHTAQWKMTILGPPPAKTTRMKARQIDYCRELRKRPLAEVSTEDVLAVIRPLWGEKRETGSRIRQRIEAVLDAAKVEGLRKGENPARWVGHLSLILPAHGKRSKGHHASLHWKQVPSFVANLRDRDGIAARALEFAILTAARSGEVRGAVWSEFDLAARVWVVPAGRMKAGREHVVPLSDRAVEIVGSMLPLRPCIDADRALVFPGTRGQMSDMTLGAVLSRMGVEATVHGFRSSFRTWGAENNVATHEALEAALAHTISNGVVAAYLRSSFFEQRRQLMDRWASFVAGGSSDDNVVPLRPAVA